MDRQFYFHGHPLSPLGVVACFVLLCQAKVRDNVAMEPIHKRDLSSDLFCRVHLNHSLPMFTLVCKCDIYYVYMIVGLRTESVEATFQR
jgi:hypothetical protein